MPRATKKPKPATKSPKQAPLPEAPPAAVIGTVGEVLTLAEAAAYLRLPEKDVLGAISAQALPARMVNGEWRFHKAAILEWLSVSQPTAEMRKAAILSIAGSCKDDPDLFPILEDAMRRRGREPGPDGTYGGYRPPDEEQQ